MYPHTIDPISILHSLLSHFPPQTNAFLTGILLSPIYNLQCNVGYDNQKENMGPYTNIFQLKRDVENKNVSTSLFVKFSLGKTIEFDLVYPFLNIKMDKL